MLRFQAKAIPLSISLARHTDQAPVKKIAGVKLQPRLGRCDFHHPARKRIREPCSKAHTPLFYGIQQPIMVIAVCPDQLLVAHADASADSHRLTEIEGCTHYVSNAFRNQASVDGAILACADDQLMIQGAARTGKVKVVVMCEVDYRGLVAGSAVINAPLVAGRERVAHLNAHLARIALFAMLADITKLKRNAAVIRCCKRRNVPPARAETAGAAM